VISQRATFGYSESEALEKAWNMVVDRNPFPATMGRICPHPCESGCNRSDKDGAVAVNAMERYLGDQAIENKLKLPVIDATARSESVGVIGSGPAGLSFAYQMARRGYPVTVYDRNDAPGGMLRHGIPDYRLPPTVLDAEIKRILDLGVELRLNTRIGKDISTDDLRNEHDIIFLGVGAGLGRALGIDGEDGPHVFSGVEFLEQYSRGQAPEVGERVVVIGGGNTAIDSARSARRMGAEVRILYRRTREEMPAIDSEIDDAIEEGVAINFLVSPSAIRRDGQEIQAIVVQRMQLGDEDESGRRRPVPLPGSEYEIETDAVIVAVAQRPDWQGLSGFGQDGEWASANQDPRQYHVWAGGDVTGPGVASMAIAHGRIAAESVHARLRGLPAPASDAHPGVSTADLNLDYYRGADRVTTPVVDPETRVAEPDLEVARTITEEEFFKEADRCLSCGMCIGCSYCWMFCNAEGFVRLIEPSPGEHFVLMLDRCESCGKCIEVCPCGFLSLDSQ
jgi:NADPH-dependent glutamate synthase beta subunit-like oxidoreductase